MTRRFVAFSIGSIAIRRLSDFSIKHPSDFDGTYKVIVDEKDGELVIIRGENSEQISLYNHQYDADSP